VLHDHTSRRRLALDREADPPPRGQADLDGFGRRARDESHGGGLRDRGRAGARRPPGTQPRRTRGDVRREIRFASSGARAHAGRPTVEPAGDRRRNLRANCGAYRCARGAAPRSAGPTRTSTVRVASSAPSSAARQRSVVVTTRSSGQEARTTIAAGGSPAESLPPASRFCWSAAGPAAGGDTGTCRPGGAEGAGRL